LRLSPKLRRPFLRLVKTLETKLPEAAGKHIRVRFRPNLHTYRGRVISRAAGQAIHAAADIRKRTIVLDSNLRAQPSELRRILIHELFHFAWASLGNTTRKSWAQLIEAEWSRRARGELGWSSEYRKRALRPIPPEERDPRTWREYLCESFCDTAAWLYGDAGSHDEFTLAPRFANARAAWFRESFQSRKLSI
jgi:hypothetical protein